MSSSTLFASGVLLSPEQLAATAVAAAPLRVLPRPARTRVNPIKLQPFQYGCWQVGAHPSRQRDMAGLRTLQLETLQTRRAGGQEEATAEAQQLLTVCKR